MLLDKPRSATKLLNFTSANEGYRQFAYSCSAGKQTIGIGFNLDDVGLSAEESRVILSMRMTKVDSQLNQLIDGYEILGDVRKIALCDLAYQIGVNGLMKFKKSLALLESHEYEKAADEFLDSRWAKQTPVRAKKVTDMIRTGEWPSA